MARQKGLAEQFVPTKGFVTEFTPTRFPSDAAIAVDNCIFDVDGSARRRPGLNFETSFILNQVNGVDLTTSEKDELAVHADLWKAVSNSGTLNIVVVQIGLVLQFYAQIGSISANLLGEASIASFALDAGLASKAKVAMA